MKTLALAILMAAVASTQAATILFDLSPAGTDRAIGMNGANEVPPNASEATGGELGSGISYDDTLNQLNLRVGFGNLLGFTDLSSSFTADHIHTAPPGVAGPVIIDLAPLTIQDSAFRADQRNAEPDRGPGGRSFGRKRLHQRALDSFSGR